LVKYRLFIFIAVLVGFSIVEFFFSYRKRSLTRISRWPHNFIILLISTLFLKVVLPTGLIYFVSLAQTKTLGLFNLININFFLEILISLILLDLAIYWQHRIFHQVSIFWKIHRVHHSDVDLDATTALRFHPIEIILSMFYKILLVLILGLSLESILIFEIILSSMAIFNHSNLYIPAKLESVLRLFIVTPQMHIIHHSVEQFESDSNYGFNLSIWDKIFKSYSPKFLSDGLIGNKRFRSSQDNKILNLLKQPFSS